MVVALIAIAWLAVPPIVRGQVESRLTDALNRKTTVETVEFDPFKLRLTLRRLAIAEPAGTVPLLTVDALVADVSSASTACSTRRGVSRVASRPGRPRTRSTSRDGEMSE